jgi:hypothetical protein
MVLMFGGILTASAASITDAGTVQQAKRLSQNLFERPILRLVALYWHKR